MAKSSKVDLTRQKIVSAAKRVLLSKGFDQVTHRLIAEEAGVPLGSTTYHFKNKSELILAALSALMSDEAIRRRKISVSTAANEVQVARYLIELLIPNQFRSAAKMSVLFERILQATRDAKVRKLILKEQEEIQSLIQTTFEQLAIGLSASKAQAIVEGRALQWLSSGNRFEELEVLISEDLKFLR